MEKIDYQIAKELIEELYISILERIPDSEGLVFHTNRLMELGITKYPLIIRDFLNSEEYKQLTKRKITALKIHELPVFSNFSHGQNRVIIHHIVSLGDHCLTSSLLKKYRLKQYSLPFDWIFSNLAAVLHVIEDDFYHFLNRNHYKSTKNSSGQPASQHLFYENEFSVTSPMFNHIDINMAENYAYTQRTVARFRELLQSDDTKLFIHIAKPDEDASKKFEQCIDLLNSLTKNFIVLIIQLKSPSHQSNHFALELMKEFGVHKLYSFVPLSQENGTDFEDQFDDMVFIKLLSQFDIQLKNLT